MMLSLFAPYTAEDMWARLGHEPTVAPGRLAGRRRGAARPGDGDLRRPGRGQGAGPAGGRRRTSPRRSCGRWRWPTAVVRGARRPRGAHRHRARAKAGQRRAGLRPDGLAMPVGRGRHRLHGVPAGGLAERHAHRGRAAAGRASAAGRRRGRRWRRATSPPRCATGRRSRPRALRRRRSPRCMRARRRRRSSGGLGAPVRGAVRHRGESARLAARRSARIQVRVVDSRSLAMGLGFAVIAAAEAVAAGADAGRGGAAAAARRGATTTCFYVDTLDHLRRGGRIGAAARWSASALAVKPLLHVDDGRIVAVGERADRALGRSPGSRRSRSQCAGDGPVDVAVQHLAAAERAAALARRLRARCRSWSTMHVAEVGAVVGAHVGPGRARPSSSWRH